MEKPSQLSLFVKCCFFSVLGTISLSCYILADTFFVSKGLGTAGLAALNLAIPIYNFIHGCGLMLGIGGGAKFTVCRSRGDDRAAASVCTGSIAVGIFLSLLFMQPGLWLSEEFAALLGAEGQVLEMTATYLKWLLIFAPAFIINDVLVCFVRNDDRPQLAMAAMLISNFSNIVLDYIFIFPMKMGIFGAIFATGLSPIISLLLLCPHLFSRRCSLRLSRRFDLHMTGQLISLGIPSLVGELSSGIVMICFNAIILRLEGNVGVAAYGVIANISLVVVAIYSGIAQGVQPLMSACHGQADEAGLLRQLRYSLVSAAAFSALIYGLLFVFASGITGIFNSEADPVLQVIAVEGLRLYFTACSFAGFNIILAIYFTALEEALPAQLISLLRGLFLIIPAAFIMSALFGMKGVWLAYPVTELVTALFGIFIFIKLNKRLK